MNEIIDVIISLFYILKYGPIINGKRDFKKMINTYKEIVGDDINGYKSYVINEMSRLRVKPHSAGIPTYAIFEKHKDITRVFILNEEIQFMYRLEDYTSVNSSFFIKLND